MGRTLRDLIARAREDIAVVFDKDPAATSVWEVLFYPHLHALWIHRLAHYYYLKGYRVGPRLLALCARFISGGIDIHPGAGRDHRPPLLHRPRPGRGDRR